MKQSKNIKTVIFFSLLILIVIMDQHYGWSKYLCNLDNLMFLQRLVDENIVLAGTIYIVFTVIGCVLLALPGVSFAIFAGIIFGPILGTVLCSLATTIGAGIAFLVGRFFLKDNVKPMVEKNRYLKKFLFDESEKNTLLVLMITRLVPLFPYNLQNFAYGITDIKFWPYLIYSFVFMLPGTAMFTIGFSAFTDEKNRVIYLLAAMGLALLVLGMGYLLKKKHVLEIPDELKENQLG